MKKDLEPEYFKHQYNARGDEKMMRLLMLKGDAGYGLYWRIIENLYENGGRIKTDWDTLAYVLRVDASSIKSIVADFDLFYLTKDGTQFGARAVDRQLEERREKRGKAREAANRLWDKKGAATVEANAMRTLCERNASAMQSRVEKSREETAGPLGPILTTKRRCEVHGCSGLPNPNKTKCPPCENGVPL